MLPFRFYLITDRHAGGHDPRELLPKLAGNGLRAVQVREKDLTPRELDVYCRELQASLVGQDGAPRFFLNDRADLAMSLGFAGVQLREDSLPLTRQPPVMRYSLFFGISTHSLDAVLAAEEAGADFVTFGPVYATPSKARYGEPLGLGALEEVARSTKLPVVAVGGITPERAKACREAGAWGVAAISAIWNAEDPLGALAGFKDVLGGL